MHKSSDLEEVEEDDNVDKKEEDAELELVRIDDDEKKLLVENEVFDVLVLSLVPLRDTKNPATEPTAMIVAMTASKTGLPRAFVLDLIIFPKGEKTIGKG